MKASVLIVLLVTSILSVGSAAVLLFDTAPTTGRSSRTTGVESPEFRWGEGTEASMAPPPTEAAR
jgi:hypothetical protein